jgi:enoyl-CoA hydratase/carnithine racemase
VFTRRGIVCEAASSWFLPRVVGISHAAEWVLTGRVFPVEDAVGTGLIRSVHAPDDLMPAARALAREIAEHTAPVGVAVSRQLMWAMLGADHPVQAHIAESRALFALARSADAYEGAMSFLDKRPARFPLLVSKDLPAVFGGEPPAWAAALIAAMTPP